MKATKDVADWIILAPLLGVSADTVKRIKAKEPEPLTQQKEIFEKWLHLGTALWVVLVSGLRHDLVQEITTADEIARQHPTGAAEQVGQLRFWPDHLSRSSHFKINSF